MVGSEQAFVHENAEINDAIKPISIVVIEYGADHGNHRAYEEDFRSMQPTGEVAHYEQG